jgi:hypothetical protein
LHVGRFRGDVSSAGEAAVDAVLAAKRTAGRIVRRGVEGAAHISSVLDRPELVEGGSIEAAIAAAAVCGLLRIMEHREEYAIRNDVAITGRINATGELLSVDESALRVKVEACIHSPIRTLVVPQMQADQCQSWLRQLFPDPRSLIPEHTVESLAPRPLTPGPLLIIGAARLEDMFNDGRVTVSRAVPMVRRAGRGVWKWRRAVAAGVIVGLALVVFRLWYGPVDRNPAVVDYEHKSLIVRNALGEILHVRPLESTMPTQLEDESWGVTYDIDHDSRKEFLWVESSTGSSLQQPGVLYCQAVDDSGPRWSHVLRRHIEYAHRQPLQSANFIGTQSLVLADVDNNGQSEVIFSAVHANEACLVLMIDALTGREVASYYHPGHLISILPVDLDGDSVLELVCGGVNDYQKRACLIVLNPRAMHGYAPLAEGESIKGCERAHEMFYALIPRTVLGESDSCQNSWNMVDGISINPVDKVIRVKVSEHCDHRVYPTTYYVYLSFDLVVSTLEVSDEYVQTARKWGLVDALHVASDPMYWQHLKKQIVYWDGAGWSPR